MGRLTSDPLYGQVSALDALLSHAPTNHASRDDSFDRHLQDARRQSSSPPQSTDRQTPATADRDQPAVSEESQATPAESAQESSSSAAATDDLRSDASSAERDEPSTDKDPADVESLAEAAAQPAASDAAVIAAAGQATALPVEVSSQVDGEEDPLLAAVGGDATKTRPQAKRDASQAEPTQNPLDPTAKAVDAAATEAVAEESASQRAENAAAVESAIEATDSVNLKAGTQSPTESASTPLTPPEQSPQAANAAAQGESSQSAATATVESPDGSKPGKSNSTTTRRDRPEVAPSEAASAAPQPSIASDAAPLVALDASAETAPAETNVKSAGDTARQPTEATALSTAEAAANLPAAAMPPKGIAASISGGAAQRGGQAGEISESDRARFVQRVARAFQSVGEDGGQLRLRLSPPELGSMRLEIMVNKGVLTAHVEAETPQARQLLLENLPALRERLQEQNIKVERFDVDVAGQSSSGWSQESARQRQQENQQRSANLRPRAAPESDAVSPLAERQRPRSGDGKLNVVI